MEPAAADADYAGPDLAEFTTFQIKQFARSGEEVWVGFLVKRMRRDGSLRTAELRIQYR